VDKDTLDRLLRFGAVITVSAGVLLMLTTLSTIRRNSQKLKTHAENIEKLQKLEHLSREARTAVRAFEQLPNPHPVPIRQLLRESIGDEKYNAQAPPPKSKIKGWLVQQMDISFTDIELSKVAAFLEKAEAQRPPWRLARCIVHSSSAAGGSGRVSFTLEALDKVK
jgi:hypothetical protein